MEWTLAALYRKGFLLERLALAVRAAQVPHEIVRVHGEEEYRDALDDMVTALEQKAAESYAEMIAAANNAHLESSWKDNATRALARLNRHAATPQSK
jgi:hypothetical protein